MDYIALYLILGSGHCSHVMEGLYHMYGSYIPLHWNITHSQSMRLMTYLFHESHAIAQTHAHTLCPAHSSSSLLSVFLCPSLSFFILQTKKF